MSTTEDETFLPIQEDEQVGPSDLSRLATQAQNISTRWRQRMLRPTAGKRRMRRYSTQEAAAITGIPKATIKSRIDQGQFPQGRVNPRNGYRSFSLEQLHQMMDLEGTHPPRTGDEPGHVVCCSNFKGGSAKSTLATYLAFYLAIRGRRVLLVDLDAQGSATSLCGWQPETDIGADETVMSCIEHGTEIADLAVPTHCDGLHVVRATPGMSHADVLLNLRDEEETGIPYWEVLDHCMAEARRQYDVIVLDTPPSLGALAMNGVYTADGLLVPLPASMVDFESCAVFFRILAETVKLFGDVPSTSDASVEHFYDYLRVVITRYEESRVNSQMARWIQGTYSPHVLSALLKHSEPILSAARQTKTLYELRPGGSKEDPEEGDQFSGSPSSYRRAVRMIDEVMDEIEQTIEMAQSTEETN